MAMTRANAENVLEKRCGPLMAKAGMAVTVVGTNVDMADPLGWALRQAGCSVADVTNPTTAEVAAATDVDEVLDLAEYRLLNNILINLDDVDVRVGPRDEKYDQLAQRVLKRIAALRELLEDEYGYGANTLEAGVLTFEFSEHADG